MAYISFLFDYLKLINNVLKLFNKVEKRQEKAFSILVDLIDKKKFKKEYLFLIIQFIIQ